MIPEQLILSADEIDRLRRLCSPEPGARRDQIQIWLAQLAREFDNVMARQFPGHNFKTTWVGFAWRCVIDDDPLKQLPSPMNAIFSEWAQGLVKLKAELEQVATIFPTSGKSPGEPTEAGQEAPTQTEHNACPEL